MSFKYLSLDEILALHAFLISEYGGQGGLMNQGLLDSAVHRPRNSYNESLIDQAAELMESLGINHPFVDGNKRVAFFATDEFLRKNGKRIYCPDRLAHWVIIFLLSKNCFKFSVLRIWLRLCVYPT